MTALERLRQGVETTSAEETRALAADLARELPPDVTLALHGDLGAGKTTFVQGLAIGFGIVEPVTSPTFTIYNLHQAPAGVANPCLLVHLDAYRLQSPADFQSLLLEEFLVSPYCLAVEWPNKIAEWLPPDALHFDFSLLPNSRHHVASTNRS